MGLDTPAQRQHGKLILLPQDVHPALRSHPPQCFLLFQVKETLCFSWILVHQDLLPAHRKKKKKNNKRTTLNLKSYSTVVSRSHFISLEIQLVRIHWSVLQHSCKYQALHVLPWLSFTHKTVFLSGTSEDRKIWHWKSHSESTCSVTWKLKIRAQSLCHEQLLDPSTAKTLAVS